MQINENQLMDKVVESFSIKRNTKHLYNTFIITKSFEHSKFLYEMFKYKLINDPSIIFTEFNLKILNKNSNQLIFFIHEGTEVYRIMGCRVDKVVDFCQIPPQDDELRLQLLLQLNRHGD